MKTMHALAPIQPETMNRARFAELVRSHHLSLLSYSRALAGGEVTARELTQDAFVAAWQNHGKFDVTKDFAAWLRGIVRNKWREHCRLHAREVPFDEEALLQLEETLAPHSAGDVALFARLADCRAKLPPLMREALCACYDDGHTSGEAANLLGLNPATLRKRLERAREVLRICLTKIN